MNIVAETLTEHRWTWRGCACGRRRMRKSDHPFHQAEMLWHKGIVTSSTMMRSSESPDE